MNASTSLEAVKFHFLLGTVLNLLTIYVLIMMFEMFENNTVFTPRQTILTALTFIIIGGVLNDPSLGIVKASERYFIEFERFSAISLSSLAFYTVSSLWIISSLFRGYKSAQSVKQKKLIMWLSIGLLLAVLLPSIQYAFTQPPEAQVERRAAFSLHLSLLRAIFQSAGMIIIGVAFLKVSKYPWLLQRQRTHFISVYSHEGVCLFSKAFDENITEDDLLLLSGGFSAVANLFQEATRATGKVKSISIEDQELRIINREHFLCALLVDYSTRASELAHEKFTITFEEKFRDKLEHFDGEITSFQKAEPVASRYFS
jgi:hypothetical protein